MQHCARSPRCPDRILSGTLVPFFRMQFHEKRILHGGSSARKLARYVPFQLHVARITGFGVPVVFWNGLRVAG